MKTLTNKEAAKQIAAILAQCGKSADLDDVVYKAVEMAREERELARLRAYWPGYNKEEIEEGRPALSWRDYLIQCKKDGEWCGPIPKAE